MQKSGGESAASMFVLSGEEHTLPFAEIDALIATYSNGHALRSANSRVAVSKLSDTVLIEKITERSAYCRFGGVILSESEFFQDLALGDEWKHAEPSEATFAVHSYSIEKEKCGELGQKIKTVTGARVNLDRPDWVFQVENTGEGYLLGLSKRGYKQFAWKKRRPRARRFFLPSAIYPKLSRALVNLSRGREGEVFLDPFCGTGSLLIESSLMGMRTVGIDLKRWIARGALLNTKEFQLDSDGVLRSDSSFSLPFKKIDAVSTDIPYGRAASTLGKGTEAIVNAFTQTCGATLEPGRFCVLMHPSTVKIPENSGLQLKEQHFLYVHRSLTRAISILKKI